MPTSWENEWGSEIQKIDSLEENDKHLEASVEQVEESVEQIEESVELVEESKQQCMYQYSSEHRDNFNRY